MIHLDYLVGQKLYEEERHEDLEDCQQAHKEPEKHIVVGIQLFEVSLRN